MVDILLWYYTKTQRVVFLEGQLPCGVWNHISELCVPVTLKPFGLCTLNASFPNAWFCNLTHGSFGKYWLTEECRSSKCWHISLCDNKKMTSVHNITHLNRKIVSFRMLSKSQWQSVFRKSKFCWKAQILSLAKNIVGFLFPLGDSLTLFTCEKSFCQIHKSEKSWFVC